MTSSHRPGSIERWFRHERDDVGDLWRSWSRRERWLAVRVYGLEWALTVLLWGLWYLLDKVDGFRREFSVTDSSLQHSYTVHTRVSATALYLIALLAPAGVILIVSLGWKRSLWDWNVGWLGLALSLALTNTATNIVKITVGRPRPDILDRCQPPSGLMNPGPPSFGLLTSTICTRTDLLKDGFRSFPSGHSSLTACGLGYLTLYLAGVLGVRDGQGRSWKVWVVGVPVMGAFLVAISRLMDYRHHPTDVIAGLLLGFLIAWWIYFLYYPALDSVRPSRAFPPRLGRGQDNTGKEELALEGGRGSDSPRYSP